MGAAALLLVWGVTAEIYAARGLNTFAERLYEATPQPVDWVDQATGGEPTLFLGQSIIDKNPIYLLEFWNRSVKLVWSIDGSAPLPAVVARSRSARRNAQSGSRRPTGSWLEAAWRSSARLRPSREAA